jgi:alpha-1,3-rhamnosyl/mannosyltransferase
MRALMRNACLSVIPSFYEGFCLPLLESFAAGVPVIATDRGSIPEIAGGAAALINPYEFDALAMAIDRMLNDKPYRDGFLAKAGKRLAEFSWERTAALTFGVYEEVLNKNNR